MMAAPPPEATTPFKVDGRTAIVTGAGSGLAFSILVVSRYVLTLITGINLAFAQLLLSRNCNVIFADLSLRPEAQKTVDETGSKAVFVKTDVTKWDQLTAMFDVADKEFGGADVVCLFPSWKGLCYSQADDDRKVCPGAGIYEPTWSNFWNPPGSASSKDQIHGTASEGVGHYALIDINVTHPIRTTQLALSRWLNPSSGSKIGKASPSNPKRVSYLIH